MNKIILTIIIPCFNEEKNIPYICTKINNIISINKNIKFIIVDNGSKDLTYKSLIKHSKSISRKNIMILKININRGYGYGIIQGLKIANSNFIGWTHADLQTDLNDILIGFEKIKLLKKNFVIKGYRIKRSLFGKTLSYGMEFFVRLILREKLIDINAQPKIFTKEIFDNIKDFAPNDFSLDLFLLFYCKKNKIPIHSFNVKFHKREFGIAKGGGNFFSTFKIIFRTIKFINKLRINNNSFR